MIRVTSGGTSRRRAIHVVVMSAATVIFITATSCSNGSSARRSVSRNAGAASLPVTNRYRSAIAAPASPAARRRRLAPALAEDELVRRPLERAVVLRAPEHRVLDLPRHREVLVGDAAGGVVAQLDPQLAPRHGEVGVVVGGLAHEADGVDDHERRRPAVGVVLAPDPVALQVPVVQAGLLELGLDLLGLVGLGLRACLHGMPPSRSPDYITPSATSPRRR